MANPSKIIQKLLTIEMIIKIFTLEYLSINHPKNNPEIDDVQSRVVIKIPISKAWYASPGQINEDNGTIRIIIPANDILLKPLSRYTGQINLL